MSRKCRNCESGGSVCSNGFDGGDITMSGISFVRGGGVGAHKSSKNICIIGGNFSRCCGSGGG